MQNIDYYAIPWKLGAMESKLFRRMVTWLWNHKKLENHPICYNYFEGAHNFLLLEMHDLYRSPSNPEQELLLAKVAYTRGPWVATADTDINPQVKGKENTVNLWLAPEQKKRICRLPIPLFEERKQSKWVIIMEWNGIEK